MVMLIYFIVEECFIQKVHKNEKKPHLDVDKFEIFAYNYYVKY